MKRFFTLVLLSLSTLNIYAQESAYFVGKKGVLRQSETQKEVSFFGVNYTMPFAHAFRVADYLGFDRKAAIDRDVYHFARLGFNAYRIHIWDVEISDTTGNLIENEHLELLDYLISKLQERKIEILLTAMTTFGNGYPERDQPTGGFSYLYDKSEVHSNPRAIKAQRKYISQLIRHKNPFTGYSYRDDPHIVGFEINNEPVHSISPTQTKAYIDTMLEAIKSTGNQKPVFYNVSHNLSHVPSYYSTAVEGTTYQWYPIGLVAGHMRKGNFLPYVDSYDIPFSGVKGFDTKAKIVYEFDPADILYSYMYPAIARTFRTAGFQWITQFAYDPIDMAAYNTEYQTHFLNLAYTPSKALSMKIAAEVAYATPRNKQFPKYPTDTIFGDFRVSYASDMSEMNSIPKFFYSNSTTTIPKDASMLESVAGCGNSAVVKYEGTGAYFLDKVAQGVWRLEVMPDAVTILDPFAKPSLDRPAVAIIWNSWPMEIQLPDLGNTFRVKAMNQGNNYHTNTTKSGTFNAEPGVFLLVKEGADDNGITADTRLGTFRLGEFVAPRQNISSFEVVHNPHSIAESGKTLTVEAQIAGPVIPDSVVIYTDKVSFWSAHNPNIHMVRTVGYKYRAAIPASWISEGIFKYTISVYSKGESLTFPAKIPKAPLDWDYNRYEYYATEIANQDSAIQLINAAADDHAVELYGLPQGSWAWKEHPLRSSPLEARGMVVKLHAQDNSSKFYIRKYVGETISQRKEKAAKSNYICIKLADTNAVGMLRAGFITTDGFTYSAEVDPKAKGVVRIPIDKLKQTTTALVPAPYPIFLKTEFIPDIELPFRITDVETFEISIGGVTTQNASLEIYAVWLE